MISYKDFTNCFGARLFDEDFQAFLNTTFSDLTEYNILDHGYITSQSSGIELGFTNNDTVYDEDEEVVFEYGNPIFSHFNLYPKSITIVKDLPFGVSFDDERQVIIGKVGNPTETKSGNIDLLDKDFLIDLYKIEDLVVTFDYNVETQLPILVQLRSNALVEEHLQLWVQT